MGKNFPMKLLTSLNFIMLFVIFVIFVVATVAIYKFVKMVNINDVMESIGSVSSLLSDMGPFLEKVDTISDEVSDMNAKIDLFISTQ